MTLLSHAANDAFPIRTVAAMTGINPMTLRTWERRYHLLEPGRTAKGHRFYSKAQIAMLHRVVALLDRGVPISRIDFSLLLADDADADTREEEFWDRLIKRMIAANACFDDVIVENICNEALALYPVEAVTRELLVPVLNILAKRGAAGEIGIAEEHFFGVYLRSKLSAGLYQRKRRDSGPRLVAACMPGQRHEADLLMFALRAYAHGYRCILLGHDIPLAELPGVTRQAQAQAIVLFASIKPSAVQLASALEQLTSEVQVPVFVGGHTSVILRNIVEQADAIALGIDIDFSFRRIAETLNDGSRPSAVDNDKNKTSQTSQ